MTAWNNLGNEQELRDNSSTCDTHHSPNYPGNVCQAMHIK